INIKASYFNLLRHRLPFLSGRNTEYAKTQAVTKKAVIYLVSNEPVDSLRKFVHDFKLDSLQTITVFHDPKNSVRNLFGVPGVPNSFVYDTAGKLIANFKGETKAEVMYQLVK